MNNRKTLITMSICFRLEKILGDRPNVRPPALYDSGCHTRATATAVEGLLGGMLVRVRSTHQGRGREQDGVEELGGVENGPRGVRREVSEATGGVESMMGVVGVVGARGSENEGEGVERYEEEEGEYGGQGGKGPLE